MFFSYLTFRMWVPLALDDENAVSHRNVEAVTVSNWLAARSSSLPERAGAGRHQENRSLWVGAEVVEDCLSRVKWRASIDSLERNATPRKVFLDQIKCASPARKDHAKKSANVAKGFGTNLLQDHRSCCASTTRRSILVEYPVCRK